MSVVSKSLIQFDFVNVVKNYIFLELRWILKIICCYGLTLSREQSSHKQKYTRSKTIILSLIVLVNNIKCAFWFTKTAITNLHSFKYHFQFSRLYLWQFLYCMTFSSSSEIYSSAKSSIFVRRSIIIFKYSLIWLS